MRHFHDIDKAAHIARVHPCELFTERLFIARFLQRKEPPIRSIPEKQSHFIGWPERSECGEGNIARPLVAVRKLGGVDH